LKKLQKPEEIFNKQLQKKQQMKLLEARATEGAAKARQEADQQSSREEEERRSIKGKAGGG
jgi:hypothetical protein